MGYRLQGEENFLFSTASRLILGAIQPYTQGVLEVRAKLLGHEADHSPSSNAEVKNSGAIRGAAIKQQD
jgi:hypothetical protein